MKFPKYAVKRPVTTVMSMFLILILGFVSLTNLKLDLMPNINPPVIAVITSYQGAGPQEIKEMVTKPVEDVVGTTQGIKSLQSQSVSNSSMVIAQYDWGTNISEIREDLSTRLERVNLAEGVARPMIVKFDPTMMPIMQLAISNGQDIEKLQQLADSELVPQLQNIEGVASVSVTGGYNKEIVVSLDQEKLKLHKLTQEQISQLLQANNLTYPGGMIGNEDEKLNLRVLGEINSIDTLKQLPVSIVPSGSEMKVVTLSEVAEVKESPKDVTSVAHNKGEQSLVVTIQKEGAANTAEVSANVRAKLAEIKDQDKKFDYAISSDQGEVVEKSVSNVSSSLMYGGLFAILVILIFLRSFNATIIISIAIPFSVVATFVLMYFSGMTLNIMSLGGLALGVGMLVDNAIVVIENIYRHLSLSKNRKEAAIDGAIEVASAVTASTLTTIAVFLPVVFIGGMVGDIFKELALTVTFSLVASWAVSLTVVPTLAGMLLRTGKAKVFKESKIYKAIISWALNQRLATLLLTTLILAGSIYLIPKIGTEFMPTQDEGMFTIDVALEEGATLDRTLDVVGKIEAKIIKMDDIDVATSIIGTEDPLMGSMSSGENTASISIKLVDRRDRGMSTEEMIEELKKDFESLSKEAELTFNLSNSMQTMSGNASATDVLIVGEDPQKIKEYAGELKKRIKDIEGITEVYDSVEVGKPEFQFIIDKEKAFQNGVTSQQVASFVNQSIQGKVATKISNNGLEKDVRVLVGGLQNSQEAIENLTMTTPAGKEIILKEIGSVERGESPVSIFRQDQQDSVTVTAKFEGTDLGTVTTAVKTEIDDMLNDLKIDTDLYTVKTTGGAEMMGDAFDSLFLAMILAIVFVYMIMASQFESLLHPIIIMVTLPLAITGVTVGLYVTDYAFGITAFIGVIILVGIVVNNAIVFVDYTNNLIRNSKMPVREALIEAGVVRLRPILMTAITTILGLLPLAIGVGEGAEMQAPMAVAVIGGLFTSTALTLVVIPVLYSLVENLKLFRKKWRLAMQKLKEAEKELEMNV